MVLRSLEQEPAAEVERSWRLRVGVVDDQRGHDPLHEELVRLDLVAPGKDQSVVLERVTPSAFFSPSGTQNVGEVFDPYVSKQTEIGAKFEWERLGASVALFTTDRP